MSVFYAKWAGSDLALADGLAASKAAVLVIDCEYEVDEDITLKSAIKFEGGGKISPRSGVEIVLEQSFEAAHSQHVFDLSSGGRVVSEVGAADGHFYAAHWGAIGAADAQPAIQQALNSQMNAVLEGRSAGRTILPGGGVELPISKPIEAFKHDGASFKMVSPEIDVLAGPGYVSDQRTIIKNMNAETPAIIVQHARMFRFRGFWIKGASSVSPVTPISTIIQATGDWYNPSDSVRDSRYSPHCGVAIDPFKDGLPADGGYPGFDQYYTHNAGSIGGIISEVGFESTLIAITQAVGGLGAQGEKVVVERCNSFWNKIFWAGGNDQNKTNVVENCLINYTWRLVDGRNYGSGAGRIPHFIENNINICWSIGTADSGRATILFQGNFIESLGALGWWTGTQKIDFVNNEIRFSLPELLLTRAPSALLYSEAPISFSGGSLLHYGGVKRDWTINVAARTVFDGVALSGAPISMFQDLIVFHDCPVIYANDGKTVGLSARHTGALTAIARDRTESYAVPGASVCDPVSGFNWNCRKYESAVALGLDVTVTINADGTGYIDDQVTASRVQSGDILYAILDDWFSTEPGFEHINMHRTGFARVTDVVGSVVNIDNIADGFSVPVVSNLYIFPMPLIRQRAVGNATEGSHELTDVTPGVFVAGNRIRGQGIPTGTFVVSEDAGTLVLSQAASSTGEITLHDADLEVHGRSASAPSSGVWFPGDRIANSTPSKDASGDLLIGWVCTAAPLTWEAEYVASG